MAIISIFAGLYSRGPKIGQAVADRLGYRSVTDRDLAELVGDKERIDPERFEEWLGGRSKGPILGRKRNRRWSALAALNLALSHLVAEEEVVCLGVCGHLIPAELPQVMRVCLVARTGARLARAAEVDGLSAREARARVLQADQAAIDLVELIRHRNPWESDLYDLFVPLKDQPDPEVVGRICEFAEAGMFRITAGMTEAAEDYRLAAGIQARLAQAGHVVRVSAVNGRVVLEINRKVLRLKRLAATLKKLVEPLDGVESVVVSHGPGSHRADIYRSAGIEEAPKVLLVDDEREYALTLSERLMMRNLQTSVAYDGESALRLVAEEEPEVIVLDLMLPGLDGREVLRRLKKDHPRVRVIILTGHGGAHDREAYLAEGAFEFLTKPIHIEELTEVLDRARTAEA